MGYPGISSKQGVRPEVLPHNHTFLVFAKEDARGMAGRVPCGFQQTHPPMPCFYRDGAPCSGRGMDEGLCPPCLGWTCDRGARGSTFR